MKPTSIDNHSKVIQIETVEKGIFKSKHNYVIKKITNIYNDKTVFTIDFDEGEVDDHIGESIGSLNSARLYLDFLDRGNVEVMISPMRKIEDESYSCCGVDQAEFFDVFVHANDFYRELENECFIEEPFDELIDATKFASRIAELIFDDKNEYTIN